MVSRFIAISLCLIAAIASYAMGMHACIVVFGLLGVMFELIFWVVLTRRSDAATKVTKTL